MQQDENNEMMKMHQQRSMIEEQAKTFLDKNALLRFGNIKLVNQEKAFQIAVNIIRAAQIGQIDDKLSDNQFKSLIQSLESQKKEFRYNRK